MGTNLNVADAVISTHKSLGDVIANIPEIMGDERKNSTEFIILVARHCNFVGLGRISAIKFIHRKYKLDKSVVTPIVSDIYKEYAGEFGSKSLESHLKVRNRFDDDDWQRMPYIPYEVYDCLPEIFQRATEKFDSRKRDIVLTGLLGVASGMLNIYGILNGETTWPNLYCFVVAPPASGKGVLKFAKATGQKRQNILRDSESVDIFIPANISTAALFQRLAANGEVGILFESEADTVANTLKNEWAQYDDLLRKAFHFEGATLERRDRSIKLEHPRLSVVLSGTRSQIQGIIPNVENGLFSRFIFYTFKSESHWDSETDTAGISLDDYFGELSETFAAIIAKSTLAKRFSFTDEQRALFHSRFEKWHNEFELYYGEEGVSIVKRLADITFRIAMILSAIRFGEQENPAETPLLYCNDVDFETAFMLAETYKHHSLFVYVTLKDNPINKKPIDMRVQMFFEKLPPDFSKAQALEIGVEIDIAERTIAKYLGNLIKASRLEQPKYGHYRKSKIG